MRIRDILSALNPFGPAGGDWHSLSTSENPRRHPTQRAQDRELARDNPHCGRNGHPLQSHRSPIMTPDPTSPKTFDPVELMKLAERCEQETGPSRKLDGEIEIATGRAERAPAHWITDGVMTEKDWLASYYATADQKGGVPAKTKYDPPSYTASLDAAMTLYVKVPERIPSNPCLATAEALRQRVEGL